MKTWALQDAKAKFSQVVDQAHQSGPQLVTRRGRQAAVVIDAALFQQLTRGRDAHDLVHFFRESPLAELPADALQRVSDPGREIVL